MTLVVRKTQAMPRLIVGINGASLPMLGDLRVVISASSSPTRSALSSRFCRPPTLLAPAPHLEPSDSFLCATPYVCCPPLTTIQPTIGSLPHYKVQYLDLKKRILCQTFYVSEHRPKVVDELQKTNSHCVAISLSLFYFVSLFIRLPCFDPSCHVLWFSTLNPFLSIHSSNSLLSQPLSFSI